MLRLKQAINECGIPQKKIVDATGFGKTQVSITLSTGKFPADADKFKDGVVSLAASSQLGVWLENHRFNVERLFDVIADPEEAPPVANEVIPDLATQIYNLAGKATIDGGLGRGTALRLVKALHFLSMFVPRPLAAEAAVILADGTGHLSYGIKCRSAAVPITDKTGTEASHD